MFAFPNTTHGPYGDRELDGPPIEVLDPLPPAAERELAGYAQALRRADRALGELVAHLEGCGRRTVLVVLGDHLPPFPGPRGVYEETRFFEGTELERLRRRHGVPCVLWSNVPGPRGELLTSHGLLAARILEWLELEPGGFFALHRSLAAELRVLSAYVVEADGTTYLRGRGPAEPGSALGDYERIQYDVLFGRRYGLRRMAGAEGSSESGPLVGR